MKYNGPFDQPTNPDAPFVDGNPATGTAGSIPPAASIEYPQREIVNLIANKALITPSNTDQTQLAKAIQTGSVFSGLDSSATPNTVTVTLSPAPSAYYNGMQILVRMANAPTDASIINVNTLGNKPIVTAGGVPIVKNAWSAGDWVEMVYDQLTGRWQAFGVVVAGAPIYLTASKDYYVGGTGANDLNDGQSAAVSGGHGPWATLQHAQDYITQFNLNGFNINIHVANGTYVPFGLSAMSGSGNVFWIGNSAAPGSCIISGATLAKTCIAAANCGKAHALTGFALNTSGTYINDAMYGVHVTGSGTSVQLTNMSWGTCPGGHYVADQNAALIIVGNEIVTGGCSGSVGGNGCHATAASGAVIQTPTPIALTVTTGVSFVAGWATATDLGFMQMLYASQTGGGSVSGKKYTVSGGVISTNGGGINYFPGTVAGTVSNGWYT